MEKVPKKCGYFFNFKKAAQNKTIARKAKIAQSGHPDCKM
jgi:hypothetical protein